MENKHKSSENLEFIIYRAFQLFEVVCLWKWKSWCHWEMPTHVRSNWQCGQRVAKLLGVVEGMEPRCSNGSTVETICVASGF